MACADSFDGLEAAAQSVPRVQPRPANRPVQASAQKAETGRAIAGSGDKDPGSDSRFSPDPMSSTDRYRLVTPFSLRL